MFTRKARNAIARGGISLACVLTFSMPIVAERPIEPERLVYILEYVSTDYEAAVRDGEIIDEAEYREMRELSRLLVDRFVDLQARGASDTIHTALLELERRIAERGSPADIHRRGTELVERILTELEIPAAPARTPDPERGRSLFAPNCAPCHGQGGRGDGPSTPGMDPPPASFVSPRMTRVSPHQVYGAIAFGIPGTAMPSYRGSLAEDDIWDIAHFVLSLGAREYAGDDPVPVLRTAADPRLRRWAAWRLERSGSIGRDAVDALLAARSDGDELVRDYAESALVAAGEAALPELVRLLEQGDRAERAGAARVLAGIGPPAAPAIPSLVERLRAAETRAGALPFLKALAGIGRASVEPLERLFAAAERPFTQELAVRGIGFVGPEARGSVAFLLDALAHRDAGVRFSAATALGSVGASGAVDALAAHARDDPSATVRILSIEALGAIGPAAASSAPVLIAVFGQGNDNISRRAATALGKMGPAVFPTLSAATAHPDPATRAYVARALGGVDVEAGTSVPLLIAALADGEERVAGEACAALIKLGPHAVPFLVDALTGDPDPRVRGYAALAIGKMEPPDPAAIPALIAALDDEGPTVRPLACWALGRSGPAATAAVHRLAAALKSTDADLRRTAAWALGNVGPGAAAATAALEKLAEDPDTTVREEAEEALLKLRGRYDYAGAVEEAR